MAHSREEQLSRMNCPLLKSYLFPDFPLKGWQEAGSQEQPSGRKANWVSWFLGSFSVEAVAASRSGKEEALLVLL